MEHPENSSEYAGLQVNSGVEQPAIVNPYLKRSRKHRRELTAAEMVEGVVKGNVTILSQAVTLVESVNPDHQAKAQEVISKCLPYSGNSIRVGISGVPGAGKSTSIDEFGIHVLREKGGRLAVLAIDPSSERSKGSILGDKTRMEKLSVHPDSFIRPSPTAGSLGGVARQTRETIILYFFPMPESGWLPKVMCYSGFYGIGIKEIWDMIYQYVDFVKHNGYFDYRRNEQSKYWMYESINEHLRLNFYNNPLVCQRLQEAERSVLAGEMTSFTAAQSLLDTYFNQMRNVNEKCVNDLR